jgi:CheY-like chemotaxis protein
MSSNLNYNPEFFYMPAYKKILLVDDDIDDRLIFGQVLEEMDKAIDLECAENGVEMTRLLEQLPDSSLPELIVLDQNMPVMTGKESLLFLKQHPRYAHIPIIIYSTFQVRDFFLECQELGVRDVVPKPDTIQSYRDMIQQFLA